MKPRISCGPTCLILVLTAFLAVLKLTDYVAWPWWLVLSPLWIGAIADLLLVAVAVILVALARR